MVLSLFCFELLVIVDFKLNPGSRYLQCFGIEMATAADAQMGYQVDWFE
jgi:hypothetical protein